MNVRIFVATFLLALGFFISPASANDESWRLISTKGVVLVQVDDAKSRPAKPGQVLVVGSTITTGASSSAEILHGKDAISMTSNSRMRILPESTDVMTKILQSLGTIIYQVEPRLKQHFSVDTPYLAAVVKGTAFTIVIGDKKDTVSVKSGVVSVISRKTGVERGAPKGSIITIGADVDDAVDAGKGESPWTGDVNVSAPKLPKLGAPADAQSPGSWESKSQSFSPFGAGFRLRDLHFKFYLIAIVVTTLSVVGLVLILRFRQQAREAARKNAASANWKAYSELERGGDGAGVLIILKDTSGASLSGFRVSGQLRPRDDERKIYKLRFAPEGNGSYRAKVGDIAAGSWILTAEAERDGESLHIERQFAYRG